MKRNLPYPCLLYTSGTYGSPAMPKAVKEGTSYNSIASGWSPVGSFRIDIDLEPGEEKEYVFIIGYAENPDDKKWESFGIINKEPAYALLEKDVYKRQQLY